MDEKTPKGMIMAKKKKPEMVNWRYIFKPKKGEAIKGVTYYLNDRKEIRNFLESKFVGANKKNLKIAKIRK